MDQSTPMVTRPLGDTAAIGPASRLELLEWSVRVMSAAIELMNANAGRQPMADKCHRGSPTPADGVGFHGCPTETRLE